MTEKLVQAEKTGKELDLSTLDEMSFEDWEKASPSSGANADSWPGMFSPFSFVQFVVKP